MVAHQNSHSRPNPSAGEDREQSDQPRRAVGLAFRGKASSQASAELVGQRRHRSGQLAQKGAHGIDPAGHHLMSGRAFVRGRLRRRGRRTFGLSLQPRLDRRIPQQLGEGAQLLGAGLGRLGQAPVP